MVLCSINVNGILRAHTLIWPCYPLRGRPPGYISHAEGERLVGERREMMVGKTAFPFSGNLEPLVFQQSQTRRHLAVIFVAFPFCFYPSGIFFPLSMSLISISVKSTSNTESFPVLLHCEGTVELRNKHVILNHYMLG